MGNKIDLRSGGVSKGAFSQALRIHDGMRRVTNGVHATGGDMASALDSLTGQAVVPGQIKSAPGYGNARVSSGRPFAATPAAHDASVQTKTPHKAVEIHPSMKGRETSLHGLGRAILTAAYDIAEPDHPANLGRGKRK